MCCRLMSFFWGQRSLMSSAEPHGPIQDRCCFGAVVETCVLKGGGILGAGILGGG